MKMKTAGLLLAALVCTLAAQNPDTGRREPLPWENSAIAASQARVSAAPKVAAAAKTTAKADSTPRTSVLIQKKIHVSDLDRFLDMWR